jgi:hypothetical protein
MDGLDLEPVAGRGAFASLRSVSVLKPTLSSVQWALGFFP